MRLLICSMGPGETSQAYAVAKYFHEKGHTVTLSLVKKINLNFLPDLPFKTTLNETPTALTQYVEKTHPDAILFCNSKIFHRVESFLQCSPFPNIPVFTLDSNWLFNNNSKQYPFIPWADKYFINFPKKVFEYGLKEKRGYFNIDESYKKRINVVGLIPSYKEVSSSIKKKIRQDLSLNSNEKLIFCYFSGFGSDSRDWVLSNLIRTVKIINKKYSNQVKIFYIGATKGLDMTSLPPWVILPKDNIIDMEHFYEYVSSADLIFQHQGLGTLAQAISARVPVIANVTIQQFKDQAAIHPGEVAPFARLNLCRMLYKFTPTKEIASTIEDLLFDQHKRERMISAQTEQFVRGEPNILTEILSSIKKHD